MAKHSAAFKRKVVDAYLQGGSARSVARRYGLDPKRVRHWAALFRHHGQAGLVGLRRSYGPEFKLQVLQQMEREGLSPLQAATLYGVRGAVTVSIWRRQYLEGGTEALSPRPRGSARAMADKPPLSPSPPAVTGGATREELLKENERLRAEVAYLKKAKALVGAKGSIRRTKPGSCSN